LSTVVWIALIVAGLVLAVLFTVYRRNPQTFRLKACIFKVLTLEVEMRGQN
jgi:hypothetical protein